MSDHADMIDAMAEEIEALRARLSEVEAEREQDRLIWERQLADIAAERDAYKWNAGLAMARENDALRADQKRMREALVGVQSTARYGPCWCDNSHAVESYGHQPKCLAATAALSSTTRQANS